MLNDVEIGFSIGSEMLRDFGFVTYFKKAIVHCDGKNKEHFAISFVYMYLW